MVPIFITLAMLPWASAVRSTAEAVDSALGDSRQSDEELGCYCKSVKDSSECVDGKDASKPESLNFFQLTGDAPLCCKQQSVSVLNMMFGIGMGWSKQKTADLCLSERLPLNPEGCCVLADDLGSVCVRVSRATAQALSTGEGNQKRFYKSNALVTIDEISGSIDYDTSDVPFQEAQRFVSSLMAQGRFKQIDGRLQCQRTLNEMESTHTWEHAECLLKARPSEECCCPAAEVEDTFRCLPVSGAYEGEQTQILEAAVSSRQEHDLEQTELSHPQPTEPETSARLSNVDPEVDGGPTWDWDRVAEQWNPPTCTEEKSLPVVEEVIRCPAGSGSKPPCFFRLKDCHQEKHGMKCTERTKKADPYIEYTQSSSIWCMSEAWTRKCPAGTAQYKRVAPSGKCMSESSGLVSLGNRIFQCPADHASGLSGASSFSPACKCEVCNVA